MRMSIKTSFTAAEPLIPFMEILKTIHFIGVYFHCSTHSMMLKNLKQTYQQTATQTQRQKLSSQEGKYIDGN